MKTACGFLWQTIKSKQFFFFILSFISVTSLWVHTGEIFWLLILKKIIELEKHSHYVVGFGFILCYIWLVLWYIFDLDLKNSKLTYRTRTGFIINWIVLIKLINQAGMLWWKYEDFLKLSFKKLSNAIKSNFLWSDNERCMKNEMLMQLVAAMGVFVCSKSYSGPSLIKFHSKGKNKSKLVSKSVFRCRFQPIISRNMYK